MKAKMTHIGLAALSALAAEGKDFSREELNAMLDKLAASPEPKTVSMMLASCYVRMMPRAVGFEYVCKACGTHTVYPKNIRSMANVLARRRDEAASLKALGLDIALDESVLCQKCRSARELGLPTGGIIVKRPPEGPKDEKPWWNIGEKVRIIDVPEHGLYRVMPVLREAWGSAKCISESGDVMGNDVYIRLSPNLDAVVLGTVNKAFPQLKRLPVRPNDPADLDDLEAAWTGASTIVFHSLHAGHWPIHFGLSFPQFVQYHNVFALGIRTFFKCISILLKMCGEDTLEKLFPSHILTMLF